MYVKRNRLDWGYLLNTEKIECSIVALWGNYILRNLGKDLKPFSIPQILMSHSQQAAYAETSDYGNTPVSPHQCIFFIKLV